MTATGQSFGNDENILKWTVATFAQLCEYTKKTLKLYSLNR